jgi:hypothetical protein
MPGDLQSRERIHLRSRFSTGRQAAIYLQLTTLLPLRKSAGVGHGTKSARTNDYCCDSSGTVTAS